jgi:hypothetical protein
MVLLKPHGTGRFFGAAFILFWLCGWAVGEGLALWLLGNGAAALMNGAPIGQSRAPLQVGPALAMGAFLLVWLALWTLGGIAAIGQFLRLTWSEDRVSAEGGILTLVSRLGPFGSRKEFPRDSIQRITLTSRYGALALETAKGMVELSRLGTLEEREAGAKALRSELGISEQAPESEGDALPPGWEDFVTPEGDRAVAPAASTRRVQAKVAGTMAVGLGALALAVFQEATRRTAVLPFAILILLGALALGWGTVWLARGRMEWRIDSGWVTLRRRFGSSAKDVFEGRRLDLTFWNDSDGDDRFALEAASDPSEPLTPMMAAPSLVRGKNRRIVTSVIGDPTVPRRLGAYLARKANILLVDRTTPEAREADLKVIQGMLEKSGPLGRLAVRWSAENRKRNQM